MIRMLMLPIALSLLWTPPLPAQTAARIAGIKAPHGYTRIPYAERSFSAFIRSLPLKEGEELLTHRGENIIGRYDTLAVVDLPLLFSQDLEQCADYAMRLWAEYHRSRNVNNLYLFDYGGKRRYFKNANLSYREFLKHSFAYSNSYSLLRGTKRIAEADLRPGDLFIQNKTGGIGHVSIVLDAVRSSGGDPLYLIGYSFMPAQELHVERAPSDYGLDGWFTLDGYRRYLDEHLPYGKPVLARFE